MRWYSTKGFELGYLKDTTRKTLRLNDKEFLNGIFLQRSSCMWRAKLPSRIQQMCGMTTGPPPHDTVRGTRAYHKKNNYIQKHIHTETL